MSRAISYHGSRRIVRRQSGQANATWSWSLRCDVAMAQDGDNAIRVAANTVDHSAAAPSFIELPVLMKSPFDSAST
jgi:hypothetical protein